MNLPKAFSDDVMAELARPARSVEQRAMELAPGVDPAWYVVETFPQCERDVSDELVARRFGIFVPEMEETVVRRGRKIERKSLMFTRYVFVFTWLNDRNYSLIRSTEGVFRFATSDGNKPSVVTYEEIDMLRRVENGKRPFTVIFDGDDGPPAFLSRKARRRWKPKPRVFNPKTDIERVRAWSAFDDGFKEMDSSSRNQILQKALGLAPSTCP